MSLFHHQAYLASLVLALLAQPETCPKGTSENSTKSLPGIRLVLIDPIGLREDSLFQAAAVHQAHCTIVQFFSKLTPHVSPA